MAVRTCAGDQCARANRLAVDGPSNLFGDAGFEPPPAQLIDIHLSADAYNQFRRLAMIAACCALNEETSNAR
ncbi:hypothetical protein GCM10023166_15890 [Paeniglutamicibacter cryotolerans]